MYIRESKCENKQVVVIGGSGKVGQNLMHSLSNHVDKSFTYFANNLDQAARIKACIQDCLAKNIQICLDKDSITNAEIIVFIGGKKTARNTNKDSLYEVNKRLIEEYLPYFIGKDIILVSNPCSQLGAYIEMNVSCRVYGVGVQNDFSRANYQNQDIKYIIGSHNVFEQYHYDKNDVIYFDGFTEKPSYNLTRLNQIRYMENQFDYLLYSDFNRNDKLNWWKIQRFHSLRNILTISCTKSILSIILYILGEDIVVHAEVRLVLDSSFDVFIGLPLAQGKIACPSSSIQQFITNNEAYVEKYRIEKN